MKNLSNISLKEFRSFIEHHGCYLARITGGHLEYRKTGIKRTLVIQSHISPIPEFIVRKILHELGLTRKDVEQFFNQKN